MKLKKIEFNNNLNPKIWDNENNLLPKIKDKVIKIVELFKNQLADNEINLIIDDIYILGSNANYNYNEDSDLDIHIIADESFDCSEKHLPTLYNAYKKIFNDTYDITIKGINVELYVENKNDLTNVSTGVYSLNKGWIKQPVKNVVVDIDYSELKREFDKWENKYFEITDNPSVDSINSYLDDIYDLRQTSLKNKGDYALGNLVFKEIRRLGYLNDLRTLKNELISKELSLEESKKLNLEEGLDYNVLYHGTSGINGVNIILDNILRLGKTYSNGQSAVCFSRDLYNIKKLYKFKVIFVFDRDKLKSKYKITPVSDYKNSVYPVAARTVGYSKAEEVITEDIINVKDYIVKVLVDKTIYERFLNYLPNCDLIIEEM